MVRRGTELLLCCCRLLLPTWHHYIVQAILRHLGRKYSERPLLAVCIAV
jgi:hypothetical protein